MAVSQSSLSPTVPPSHIPHRLGKATFPSTSPARGVSGQKGLIDNGHEETEDIWNEMVFPLGVGREGPQGWKTGGSMTQSVVELKFCSQLKYLSCHSLDNSFCE